MLTLEEKQAELEQFGRDAEYYNAHYEELLRQYPDQWIAIFKETVVGADPDFRRLLDEVQAKGIPLGRTFTQHMTTTDELLILTL